MSKWHTISCAECGADVPVHEDWTSPPRYCKDCKEAVVSVVDRGGVIRIQRDTSKRPSVLESTNTGRQRFIRRIRTSPP